MKKTLTISAIIIVTIALAVISILTAIRIREMGTRPVAPSVPESKPQAEEVLPSDLTPAPECQSLVVLSSPTATPTPTPSATGTPGPTSTPTSSPTPTEESRCEYLRADKPTGESSAGVTPLTVRFTGKGYDAVRVKGFRFTFGDGEKEEVMGSFSSSYEASVTHEYTTAGTYKAVLEILDDADRWKTRPECELTLNVSSPTTTPQVEGPSPTEVELPKAGIKIPTLGGIIMGFLLISLGAALVF